VSSVCVQFVFHVLVHMLLNMYQVSRYSCTVFALLLCRVAVSRPVLLLQQPQLLLTQDSQSGHLAGQQVVLLMLN